MTITVFADIILPLATVAAAGLRGKNGRRNSRAASLSGRERVNVIWSKTLRKYDFGFVPMLPPVWETIQGIHEVTDAGAYGFLITDPKDEAATVATGRATAITSTVFQLTKRYRVAGSTRTKDRNITRPKAAGFVIYNSGAAIGVYTLDDTTGRVTIPSAPAAINLSWSAPFYVPVHFENDDLDWELVRAGAADTRLIMGMSIMLKEIRE